MPKRKTQNEPEASPRPSALGSYQDQFFRLLDFSVMLEPSTGVIKDANDACEGFFRIPIEQLGGRSLSDFIYEKDRARFLKQLRIARRRYYRTEFKIRFGLDGAPPVQMRLTFCMMKLQNQQEILSLTGRVAEVETASNEAELREEIERLRGLCFNDEKTGLWNYRYFTSQIVIEHERASRYGHPYSVIFCDVDHFKKFNDGNGHQAGDELLRMISQVIQMSCRKTDIACRYGGEEFVVLCPEVDAEKAHVLAERIRTTIEAIDFPGAENQPGGKVTVSIGVAAFPAHASTPEESVEAADRALYQAKHEGRNRTVIAKAEALKKPKAPTAA